MPKPRSRAVQAQELIEAIDALVSWVKNHQDQVLDYFRVVKPQLHPLGARVEMLAEALGLASPEDPVYLAGEPQVEHVGQGAGAAPVMSLVQHKTWPGWAERGKDKRWWYHFRRITMFECPWYDWMAALRRKAEMILAKEANAQAPVPPHAAGPVAPAIDKGRSGKDRRKRKRGGKKRKPRGRGRPPMQPHKRRPNTRRGDPGGEQGDSESKAAPESRTDAPPSGEWIGPVTKAEMARRVLNDRKARWRKVGPMFPPEHVQKVTAKTFRFRIDLLDTPTRDRCRNQLAPRPRP